MNPLYWLLAGVGIALQLFLVYSLTAKRYSIRLPYLYAYSIILVLTEGIDLGMRIMQPRLSTSAMHMWAYYWTDDFVRQFALFLVVISLLYVGGEPSPAAKRLRKQATGAVIVIAVASGFYFRNDTLGTWATEVVRNISFAVVFVNLVLWSFLIRTGKTERLPLMLTTGIGLQMAGEAMGQALRSSPLAHHSHVVVLIGNLILILSHILCLVTWLYALRADERHLAAEAAKRKASQATEGSSPASQNLISCQMAPTEFHPARQSF